MTVDPQDRSQFPFLDPLEAGADVFRREALALPDEAFVPLPDASTYTDGRWEVCILKLDQPGGFPADLVAANRARCPETWARIAELDGLVLAGVMRLSAGGRIRGHGDESDGHVVRVHVGLQLPASEHAVFPEGAARLMDVRRSYQTVNDGDRARVTLCCDFRMPFTVPDDAIPAWSEPVPKARPYLHQKPTAEYPQPEDALRATPEMEREAIAAGRVDVQPEDLLFQETPKAEGDDGPAVAGSEDPADAPTEKA